MEYFPAWVIVFSVIFLIAILGLLFAALWQVFEKAGIAGWKALIPVYNIVVWLQLSGRPEWWVLPILVPVVNLYFLIDGSIELSRRFGKTKAFGIGLVLLFFTHYLILGFGDDEYVKPEVY